MSDIKDAVENKIQQFGKNPQATAREAGTEIAKSGKDWLAYVQSHPLQSVLFGIIGYFALKGILRN